MKKALAATLAFAALAPLAAEVQAQDGSDQRAERHEQREQLREANRAIGERLSGAFGGGDRREDRREFHEDRREFREDRRELREDLREARREFRRGDRSRYVYVQPRNYYYSQPSFGFDYGYSQPFYGYNRPYYRQPYYGHSQPYYSQPYGYGYSDYGYGSGYGYHPSRRWVRGQYLPPEYRGVVIHDYHRYGYGPPPHGYQYYRTNTGEIILAAIATGLILSVFANAF